MVVLVKLCFATGVLSIPAALGVVGYGPGLVLLALWSSMATCRCSQCVQYRERYLTQDKRLRLRHVPVQDGISWCAQYRRRRDADGWSYCSRSRHCLVSLDVDVSLSVSHFHEASGEADCIFNTSKIGYRLWIHRSITRPQDSCRWQGMYHYVDDGCCRRYWSSIQYQDARKAGNPDLGRIRKYLHCRLHYRVSDAIYL